jgi:acyl-CoA thioester hydrolase
MLAGRVNARDDGGFVSENGLTRREWMEGDEACALVSVRYAETDAMGIVHHSNYIVWFEEGRSSYMRCRGFPYSQVEASGLYFTVAEVLARYIVPAHYEDLLLVRTRIGDLRSRGLRFDYRIIRARDDTTLVTGYSKHICITHAGQPVRIPSEMLAALRAPGAESG